MVAAAPFWTVILAYVLFGLGALLIVTGMIRVTWYCCVVRKEEKRAWKNFYDNPSYFSAHLKDPWLKDNALVSRRLENGEKESLRDINISEFLHETPHDNAAKLGAQLNADLYNSLSPAHEQERTHIDQVTVQSQARYEEPNTNLILALKEQHSPPPEQLSSYGSNTALVNPLEETPPISSARSEDTRAALSALDLATAGEERMRSDLDTSQSGVDEPNGEPMTPHTPHPNIATANEPLPGDSEVYVFSTVYVQDSTEL